MLKTIDSEKRPWVTETPFAEDNRAGKKTVSEREAVGTPISMKIVQEEVKKWLHQRRGKLKPLFFAGYSVLDQQKFHKFRVLLWKRKIETELKVERFLFSF